MQCAATSIKFPLATSLRNGVGPFLEGLQDSWTRFCDSLPVGWKGTNKEVVEGTYRQVRVEMSLAWKFSEMGSVFGLSNMQGQFLGKANAVETIWGKPLP